MKFCDKHWADLREAIKANGLGERVSATGAELKERLENVPDPTDSDPLFGTFLMIAAHSVEVCGAEAMMNNADGSDRCVLCWIPTVCPCGKPACCDWWITDAAAAMAHRVAENAAVSS
jgi:hypothetical protein